VIRIGEPFREPSGLLGLAGAWTMARWGGPSHRYAISLLDAQPGQHIVEIGPAHGALIQRLTDAVPDLRVTGIEPSADMVGMATGRNRALVESGQVEVRQARVSDIPLPHASVDGVVSTHSLYFWPDLAHDFGEIARILRQGGRLVLAFRAVEQDGEWMMAVNGGTNQPSPLSMRRLRELVGLAGFGEVRTRLRHLRNRGMWGKEDLGSVVGVRR
jgi:SAM-dependent methyltransferase